MLSPIDLQPDGFLAASLGRDDDPAVCLAIAAGRERRIARPGKGGGERQAEYGTDLHVVHPPECRSVQLRIAAKVTRSITGWPVKLMP
jgi:hypothetical protein